MNKAARVLSALIIALPAALAAQGNDDREAVLARANAGDAAAQSELGVMMALGRGGPVDEVQALHWFRAAAEQGDARGQYNLGVMYDAGRGVVEDDQEAVRLYREAALQGHAAALNNLGAKYANGEGLTQDAASAVHFLALSARAGHALAQPNIERNLSKLKAMAIAKPGVNVRGSADVAAPVVLKAQKGDKVFLLGEAGDGWVEVYHPRAKALGFVKDFLLTESI